MNRNGLRSRPLREGRSTAQLCEAQHSTTVLPVALARSGLAGPCSTQPPFSRPAFPPSSLSPLPSSLRYGVNPNALVIYTAIWSRVHTISG